MLGLQVHVKNCTENSKTTPNVNCWLEPMMAFMLMLMQRNLFFGFHYSLTEQTGLNCDALKCRFSLFVREPSLYQMAILSRVPSLANGERAFELTARFTRRKPQAQLVGHQGMLEMFISFLFCIFSLKGVATKCTRV